MNDDATVVQPYGDYVWQKRVVIDPCTKADILEHLAQLDRILDRVDPDIASG